MMPSGIAMGILNPVAGKMYDRIGGRTLALLGFAIMTSAAVLLVTIMNTHTAAAMRTGVPEAAASAIGVRASFRTVAIVCAVCLVASLFIRDRCLWPARRKTAPDRQSPVYIRFPGMNGPANHRFAGHQAFVPHRSGWNRIATRLSHVRCD